MIASMCVGVTITTSVLVWLKSDARPLVNRRGGPRPRSFLTGPTNPASTLTDLDVAAGLRSMQHERVRGAALQDAVAEVQRGPVPRPGAALAVPRPAGHQARLARVAGVQRGALAP